MVLVDSSEPDKKESTQRKMASRSRNQSSGAVWPCTMTGCNKQFAREADLKRHQRTTKSHSNPGFACPQCDATFTRMDALRRHQRSRHNGVVIEISSSQEQLDAPSNSRSSSATPSLKGKERTDQEYPSPTPYYYPPANPSSAMPRLPPILPIPPIGLPTSATRTNPPSDWNPGPIQTSFPSHHDYHHHHPSPHYRLRPSDHLHLPLKHPHDRSVSVSSSESRPHTPPPDDRSGGCTPLLKHPPVIDPLLEAESARSSPYPPTQPTSRSNGRKALHVTEDVDYPPPSGRSIAEIADRGARESRSVSREHTTTRSSSRELDDQSKTSSTSSTDEIITEDGQQMLNPGQPFKTGPRYAPKYPALAELLTQASPVHCPAPLPS